jgi:magnesium transporter
MKQVQSKITWIDITNPNQSDIDYLGANYKFHPLILAELMKPSSRSKVETYNNYIYIVYYIPIYDPCTRVSKSTEIDFLITKDAIITARYSDIEPINTFFNRLEKDITSHEKYLDKTTGHLLYEILENCQEFSLRQLTHINEKVCYIEESIFKGNEKQMIKEISFVKRDVLDQRLITRPQKTILESLLIKGSKFFGKDMEVYLNDLIGDHEKVWDTLDNLKETIEALESTNNTLFESKTNEIMKLLTIMAFVTFPLSLISNIFSMNTNYTPFTSGIYGFWIIIGIMFVVSIIFFILFKIKKWL